VILALIFHPPWGESSSSISPTRARRAVQASLTQNSPQSPWTSASAAACTSQCTTHPRQCQQKELDAVGRVIHFSVTIRGFRGKALPIYWWVLTPGGEPVPEKTLQEQLAQFEPPNTCTTGGRREIWVKLPNRIGKFKIEVQLLQPDGGELDDIRTPTFSVRTPQI
jgi:hypothetical protein